MIKAVKKCVRNGCEKEALRGSNYCRLQRGTTRGSSSKKKAVKKKTAKKKARKR